MKVYNVKRRFYALKEDAESCRKALGLKPNATIPLSITNREGLAAFLTGLCEPTLADMPDVKKVLPAKVVDDAYVEPTFDVPSYVPLFLIKDEKQRAAALERLLANGKGAQ
jgi:hypothetical protein